MVPKGLPLKKVSCIAEVSTTFLTEWNKHLQETKLKLIGLLRTEVKHKREEMLGFWEQRMQSLDLEEEEHVVVMMKEKLANEEKKVRMELATRRRRKMENLMLGQEHRRPRLNRRTIRDLGNLVEQVQQFNDSMSVGGEQRRDETERTLGGGATQAEVTTKRIEQNVELDREET